MKTAIGNSRGHMTDVLFTLALFCVFAASALMVVLIGARVYRNTVERMNMNFYSRTSVTYVSTKIRQNDRLDSIYTDKMGDIDALVLEQGVDGRIFQTWIYYYDGELREVFVAKDSAFTPESGQAVMRVESFSVQQAGDNLLRLTSTDPDGNPISLMISTRC